MNKEMIEAIYFSLPKKLLYPRYGKCAADVAAYTYLLNHFGDNEAIAHRIVTYHNTGYAEYDLQYINVLTSLSQ